MPENIDISSQNHDKPNDMFTRLSIRLCEPDNGIRPINEEWQGCDKGYLSPDISFSEYPVPIGQSTDILIHIWNRGTMDATGVTLEVTCNIYIGNENQGMTPIGNQYIGNIPAGESIVTTVPWTPPDVETTHGCVHARVFDTYSIINYSQYIFSWNSFTNPQAGSRNATLVKLTNTTDDVVIPYKAKNWFKENINVKIAVIRVNQRTRAANIHERFPLPFRIEPVRAQPAVSHIHAFVDHPRSGVSNGSNRLINRMGTNGLVRLPSGLRVPAIAENGLWPSAIVRPEFRHNRFGVDIENKIPQLAGHVHNSMIPYTKKIDQRALKLEAYSKLKIKKKEEKIIHIVIPANQLPPRGRRYLYQVHYQVGNDRPIHHYVYLQH